MAISTDTQACAAQETPDGTLVGRNTTSKVGFYGTTPIVRPILASAATTVQIVAALQALGITQPA